MPKPFVVYFGWTIYVAAAYLCKMTNKPSYKAEERLNTISHALGILFGVVGLFLLLDKDAGKTKFSASSIYVYSFSFVLLFSGLLNNQHFKKVFKVIIIYNSYTNLC